MILKNTTEKNSIIDKKRINYCMTCGDEAHCATACDEKDCDCNYCACDNCAKYQWLTINQREGLDGLLVR